MNELLNYNEIPDGKEQYIEQSPVSIAQLYRETLPSIVINDKYKSTEAEYARLGNVPFRCFRQEFPDRSVEVALLGQPISGRELNHLMFFAAPDRNMFGLDTDDITGDWQKLYEDVDAEQKRRARHAQIPGWNVFEDERKALLAALLDWGKSPEGPRVTPLIRWKRSPDGEVSWVFDTQGLDARMISQVSADQHLSALAGLTYLYAYSPSLISKFPKQMGYNPEVGFKGSQRGHSSQTMGSTQVLPVLAFSVQPEFNQFFPNVPNIFTGLLVSQLEAYAATGAVPEIVLKASVEIPDKEAVGDLEQLKIPPKYVSQKGTGLNEEYSGVDSSVLNYLSSKYDNNPELTAVTKLIISAPWGDSEEKLKKKKETKEIPDDAFPFLSKLDLLKKNDPN